MLKIDAITIVYNNKNHTKSRTLKLPPWGWFQLFLRKYYFVIPLLVGLIWNPFASSFLFFVGVLAEDTTTTNLSNTSSTSVSFSHTCSGNNRALIVAIANYYTVSLVKYNNISMTQESAQQSPVAYSWSYMYSLIAPTSGTNNVTYEKQYSTYDSAAIAISFTGADQSDCVEATGVSSGNIVLSETTNITTINNGAILVHNIHTYGVDNVTAPIITGGGGQTEKYNVHLTAVNGTKALFDIKTIASAGATSMTSSWSNINAYYGATVVAVKPLPPDRDISDTDTLSLTENISMGGVLNVTVVNKKVVIT